MFTPNEQYAQYSLKLIEDIVEDNFSPVREKVHNAYECYALSHFLHYYPSDLPFKDILELVRVSDDRIFPWDLFLECEPYELMVEIEAMRDTLEECFTIREKGNTP